MGIPELWELLKPGFSRRVSIDELVDKFIKNHQRTPRIAIDAYLFIFQADHSSITVEDKDTILIQNVMSKILALIGLNISVVVVFDGVLKPQKTKSKENLGMMYEQELERLSLIGSCSEHHPVVEKVKDQLRRNKINYVQAAGEGEAQCAYLQKLGIVDYCLSQDGDALVFGANKVLRNFSKYLEDIGRSPSKKSDAKLKQTYYVTPVDIKVIEKETGLSVERLIFLASLRGGDYSAGVRKIGITNAKNLALCGTCRALYHSREKSKIELKELKKNQTQENTLPPPDFANELIQCFVSDRLPRLHPWELRLEPEVRHQKFTAFLNLINYHIKENNRDIFGRKLTIDEGVEFDEYYTMLYLFPLINDRIPIFKPDTLGSGELKADQSINLLGLLIRLSSCDGKYYKQNVGISIRGLPNELKFFFIPSTYNWSIKYVLIKLLTHPSTSVKVTNFKEEAGVEKLMLKFDINEVCKQFPECTEARKSPGSSSPGRNYIWVPKSLVELHAPNLLEEFINQRHEQEYIKKHKCSPQKTTLDAFGLSPSKKPPVPFDLKSISPKKSGSSKVSPSPKKRKKDALLPGQTSLDFFMKKSDAPKKKNIITNNIPDLSRNEAHVAFKEDDNPFVDSPGEAHVEFNQDDDPFVVSEAHVQFKDNDNPFLEAPMNDATRRADAFFLSLPDIKTDDIFVKRRPT